jgi:hypothetical protein
MLGEKNGFSEHYERVKRLRNWLDRFDISQKEYEDFMWSFFQASHHLKDWIKGFHPDLKADVEEYINNSQYLKIGADLANRSKHYNLKNIRGGDADINRNDVTIGVNTLIANITQAESSKNIQTPFEKPVSFWKYYVDIPQGKSYDQIELADQILIEWETYIKSRNIG